MVRRACRPSLFRAAVDMPCSTPPTPDECEGSGRASPGCHVWRSMRQRPSGYAAVQLLHGVAGNQATKTEGAPT